MKKIFILLLIINTGIYGCRRGCIYVDPGDVKCKDSYSKIEGVQTHYQLHHHLFEDETTYVVQDSHTYDTLFYSYSGGTGPFGEIDFTKNTLIGMDEFTSSGKEIKYSMGVCKNEDSHTIMFTVRYSLSNQCAGSGIEGKPASFWAVIPKVSESEKVLFEPIDVNPL